MGTAILAATTQAAYVKKIHTLIWAYIPIRFLTVILTYCMQECKGLFHIFYSLFSGASTLARNKNYYKPQKCGLFYVKFYLFLCCTELYFIFICDIMRYETQL